MHGLYNLIYTTGRVLLASEALLALRALNTLGAYANLLQSLISLLRKVNVSAPTGGVSLCVWFRSGITNTAMCVLSRPFGRGLAAEDIISYHIIAREWRGHHPPHLTSPEAFFPKVCIL